MWVRYCMNCREMVIDNVSTLEHLRYHQSRAELGLMPTWVVRMVAGVVFGEWPKIRRGLSLFNVFADVDSGAFGLVLAS